MKYPKIEICGADGKAMYITIDDYVFYIDNTTNEHIMDCWNKNEDCGVEHEICRQDNDYPCRDEKDFEDENDFEDEKDFEK